MNRAASQEFYDRFIPVVRAIVSRVLRDRPSEWDDACQTIFLRLFTKVHQWRGECPLENYVQIVAARTAISISRELKRNRWEIVLEDPPAASADDHTLAECIEHTVASFKPEWRRVVELIDAGFNREEIAKQLGRTRRAIQGWLVHIRERLLPCIN